jgi:hypothetical protein
MFGDFEFGTGLSCSRICLQIRLILTAFRNTCLL